MKRYVYLVLLVSFFTIPCRISVQAQDTRKSSSAKVQSPEDRRQALNQYVDKFLEFTSKSYDMFTGEMGKFLSQPNAFLPDKGEGKIISEVRKQAGEDIARVQARARYKFGKAAGDTLDVNTALSAVETKFYSRFNSAIDDLLDQNNSQYKKAGELPEAELAAMEKKNKAAYTALLKKLSLQCDKIGEQYEEYTRCNIIKEALTQSGGNPDEL